MYTFPNYGTVSKHKAKLNLNSGNISTATQYSH